MIARVRTGRMVEEVTIPVGLGRSVRADVAGKSGTGTVLFAHGSGSSRRSRRNRQVADSLHARDLQTVLVDLLTDSEEQQDAETREHRFDIDLLTDRVLAAIAWLRARGVGGSLGLFGASTGAAAALRAAAAEPEAVAAIVSRGGRPDMAGDALGDVPAPTLLIVGGNDPLVLELNRRALTSLNSLSVLEVVEGASHLFEEPGTLERVAELASAWFEERLRPD